MAEVLVQKTEAVQGTDNRTAWVDKPAENSTVELIYVRVDGAELPKYVEVRFHTPDAEMVSVNLEIPQDGKRYGVFLQENATNAVLVRLQPL